MKSVDMKIKTGVPFAQVALKPRVNGRNLAETQVFLCPTEERLSGVGVIQYLLAGKIPAVSIDGFKTPGNLESAILEKQWRYTMKAEVIAASTWTHPHDLLQQTIDKLQFLCSSIMFTDIDHGHLAMTEQTRDGLYYTLSDFADTLKYVHNKLENPEVKP